MKNINILKRLFTEQELEQYLQESHNSLQEELNDKNYAMASFYSLDLARLYEINGFKEKSKKYYKSALEYLNCADFQPISIGIECLLALGQPEKSLEVALNSNRCRRPRLAALYEEVGQLESAQQLYGELAVEQIRKTDNNDFFQLHFLQGASDLWDKAHNAEKAREYNQKAVEAWEKMKDTIKGSLIPIEEAWLYEEVGYIYEKAGEFKMAVEYYQEATLKYEQAYAEDFDVVATHQIDGDWDYYKEYFFYVQFLGLPMFRLSVEHPMNYDLRRVKYRILNLEEKISSLRPTL